RVVCANFAHSIGLHKQDRTILHNGNGKPRCLCAVKKIGYFRLILGEKLLNIWIWERGFDGLWRNLGTFYGILGLKIADQPEDDQQNHKSSSNNSLSNHALKVLLAANRGCSRELQNPFVCKTKIFLSSYDQMIEYLNFKQFTCVPDLFCQIDVILACCEIS